LPVPAIVGEERLSVSNPDDTARKASQVSKAAQVFMALPSLAQDSHALFYQCLAILVDLLDAETGPEEPGTLQWYWKARRVIRTGLDGRETLPGQFFDALVRAGIYDPNPSSNAQFIKPATAAFGCLRVLQALLGYVRDGTNAERAGAARASYWASAAWRWEWASEERQRGWWRHERPLDPDGSLASLRQEWQEWQEAILREFVANEDIDVRRSILPGLPLSTERYPDELHCLVAKATCIARSHPDEYIRHRVEIQVHT
jgi:hypothetical protein